MNFAFCIEPLCLLRPNPKVGRARGACRRNNSQHIADGAGAPRESGHADFNSYKPGGLPVGTFLTALVAFIIVAAVVYFAVVVPYTKMRAKFFPAEEAGTPEDIQLLTEIRDALTQRGGQA